MRIVKKEVDSNENIQDVLIITNKIIKKHEPDISVKEKVMSKPKKKILLINGLSCTNCALKIEKAINKIEGVKSASVDFVSGKLTIETTHKHDLHKIVELASKIAKNIESDIKIVESENRNKEIYKFERIPKLNIVRFVVGVTLFFIALFIQLPFWIGFGIYFASYILVGGKVVLKAFKNILRGQVFDENFLMSIATIGAFAIREFPEGVAVMLFYQVGYFFQSFAVNKSRKSISDLMDIRPDYVNIKVGEDIKRVSPEEINVGDIIIIKPGEKIPLDGTVIEGKSMIDTSSLTGESVPKKVKIGNEVLSGAINKNGLLTVKVNKKFSDSTVSKILDLVQNASSKKAPTENFITKFARYYTPIVVFTALTLAVIPPLAISGATFSDWINRALVFLVVSCPCALVISIPLGFFGGIGGASKKGILVKGSNYLEALNNVDTVVFDKTGTITKGVFNVTKINSINGETKEKLLEYASFAESYSNHPIATSILKAYGKVVNKNEIDDYDEISGHGIKVRVRGKEILVGNAKLMHKEKIPFDEFSEVGTVVHIAIDGKYAGYLVISDEVKDDSKKAIQELKSIGVKKIVMLTGDSKAVGDKIGSCLGFDEVHSELLPGQKVENLEMLEKQKVTKGKLLFVGDGINDAPVLTRADVGIAMGGLGSDAAIEAADVVIMTDEPSKIVSAIKIAKRTRIIVWQNIFFAMSVKGIVLILGAGGIATMWEAVFADVGVTLIAVINSMRAIKNE